MTTMNTPKHTPGPWRTYNMSKNKILKQWHIQRDDCKHDIALVSLDVAADERESVANLIAAAPAMYEALKDLLGELGDLHDGSISELQCHWCGRYYDDLPSGSLCPSDDCPGYKARAALAQAEGRDK